MVVMRSRTLVTIAAWMSLVVLASPSIARADGTADEAELHFRMGAADFRKGDYEGALAHFLASNRLVPNRNVVFNIASTFEQLKRWADAHRYYVDALDGETKPDAIAAVRAAIAKLSPNVAVLDIATTPPGATIYIDRKDLGSRGRSPRPLALPVGRYRVIVELEGHEPLTSEVIDVALGSEKKVALALRKIAGTVEVRVDGPKSAAVRVGDEKGPVACNAPCSLDLAPGTHEIFASAEKFATARKSVTIAARQKASVTLGMTPLTGSAVVKADELGAEVAVDGKVAGFTPAVITGLAVGKRRVKVSLRSRTPAEVLLDIEPDRQAETPLIKLEPLRIVTAVSRYEEQIDDAPSSLSIVSAEEIRAFGYPTIADALRGVRGFSVSNDRAYAAATVRALGQPEDYGNRLLVLSDGQSLNDNINNSSTIGSSARVDLEDVDRIEVVRGPGSLLYGAGAFSGVVNLVTRPRDDKSAVFGSFGVYDNHVIRGRAGFHYNFAPDKGVWASVALAHSEGSSLAIPAGKSRRAVEGVEAFTGVTAAGRGWVGPFSLQWLYAQRGQSVPVGAFASIVGDPRTRLDDKRMMAELKFERQFAGIVDVLVRVHGNRYTSRETFSLPGELYVEDYIGTWVGGEARVAVRPTKWLRLTAGGEGQYHPQATIEGTVRDLTTGGLSTYLDEKTPYRFGAAYAIAELTPSRYITLSGGARVDIYSTFGVIPVPRGAVILHPVKGSTLKLMGGRAFRAPSIYEQVYNDGGFTQARAVDPSRGLKLGPESVYSGEVEYSHRFAEDWVVLGAGHASYVQNLIEAGADAPGSSVLRFQNSAVPVLVAGGDVEIRREMRSGWMVTAAYGYQRARYLSSSLKDTRVAAVPEHVGSIKGVAPLVPNYLSLALRVTVEAPRRISLDASDVTKGALLADVVASGKVPRYGIWYNLGVYNVADWRWEVPVSSTFASKTMPQNGRTFLVNVGFEYPPKGL